MGEKQEDHIEIIFLNQIDDVAEVEAGVVDGREGPGDLKGIMVGRQILRRSVVVGVAGGKGRRMGV